MTKRFKKLTIVTLLIAMVSAFTYGCNEDKPNDNETTAATTIKEVESTSEKETTTQEPTTVEPTTQEPTTEEPTTEYVQKGLMITVEKKNAEKFNGLVIESGHVFYINDFCSDSDSSFDTFRGDTAFAVMAYIGLDTTKFEQKYFPAGAQAASIPHSDNYSFTYTGDKKYTCTFMMEIEGYVYFDLYEVE